MQAIERLVSHAESQFLYAGVLSVVQPRSNPKTVYRFLKNLQSPSMNFLMQDGNYDEYPIGKACLQIRKRVPGKSYRCLLEHIDSWPINGKNPRFVKGFNRPFGRRSLVSSDRGIALADTADHAGHIPIQMQANWPSQGINGFHPMCQSLAFIILDVSVFLG